MHFEAEAKQKVLEEMNKSQRTRFIRPSSQQNNQDGPYQTQQSFPHSTMNEDLMLGQEMDVVQATIEACAARLRVRAW